MPGLAHPARFERAAFRLGGERSILLSYGRNNVYYATVFAACQARRGKTIRFAHSADKSLKNRKKRAEKSAHTLYGTLQQAKYVV